MSSKTILTVAITGSLTKVEHNPALPCSPKQVAESALEAAKAGAAVAHIHVRYPDGRPSVELEHYREVMNRVRDGNPDLIINLTTGPGARFIPSKDDPSVGAPGTNMKPPLVRIAHVLELQPEICTLDLNTMMVMSANAVSINTPENVQIMAEHIKKAGVKPEIEVFDSGDMHLAQELIDKGVLESPPLVQIVLGIKYGFSASLPALAYAHSLLPKGAIWAAFGISRAEFPVLAGSFWLGGHVRVGFEDNIYLRKGQLAPSNAALCSKAARIVDELGGELATPKEARQILGLRS